MGRKGIATEHAGFKRNSAQLPLVCKVPSLVDLGFCAETQSINSTEAEYSKINFLGKEIYWREHSCANKHECFTYKSFLTWQSIISLEKTENSWVMMLPETKYLRNTAQNKAQTKWKQVSRMQCGSVSQLQQWYWWAQSVTKAVVLTQWHLRNSSMCWTARCRCNCTAAPFSLRECLLFPTGQCWSGKSLCQITMSYGKEE